MVCRPFESALALSLKEDAAAERLLYHLLPGAQSKVDSRNVSDAFYRDTLQHFGHGIGLQEWRQITVALNQVNKDPGAVKMGGNQSHNMVRGHTDAISDQNYGMTSEKPKKAAWTVILACERVSAWWQHITGMWLQSLTLHIYNNGCHWDVISFC